MQDDELTTALARYLRWHRTEGSSPKTVEWHTNSIGLLVRYLARNGQPTTLAGLTVDNVRDWLDDQRQRGLATKTLNTRTRSVKAFSHWLTEEEYFSKDPLARLRPTKVDDTAKDYLTPDEVATILQSIDRRSVTGLRDYALCLVLYSTAIRATEARLLQTNDVDWKAGAMTIRRGKGGKGRTVPLRGTAERALHRYLVNPLRRTQTSTNYVFLTDDGTPFTKDGFRQIFFRLARRTGISCNPHKWRHSAAIQYLRNGGKVENLQKLLGHTSITMTLHYARIAGVDVLNGHEQADPANALKGRNN